MNPASIRSSCRRSTLRTSAHSIASSTRRSTVTPSSSMPRGINEWGPHTATWAPSFVRPQMLERATRECRMSPTRHTFTPSIRPSLSRIVSRSRRAWVGCSCLPSPAFTTLERMRSPRNCAAPEEAWRITTMSMRIASRFLAVSTSVSPFCTALPVAATFTVSAERRFSANSKEMRVRVEASKKRLTIVLPRSAGTFLMGRSDTSLNGSAVSRMRRIWSGERRSRPIRSFPNTAVMGLASRIPRLKPLKDSLTVAGLGETVPLRAVQRRAHPSGWEHRARSSPCPAYQIHLILPIQLLDHHIHPIPRPRLDHLADDVRLDRQFPAAAVHQHAQRDALGPAEVGELVERRAHGAARVEDVVHDDGVLAREVARESGLPDHGLRSHGLEIIAIEGDVEGAAGHEHALLLLDQLGDPLGQLDAAPLDADEHEIVGPVSQLDHGDRHTLKRPRQSAGVQDAGPFGPAHLEAGS